MNNKSSKSLSVLALAEIASWQIADDRFVQAGPADAPIIAGLPALQRGAVWKSQQVEEVWDSLVQGFPIGEFLVSPVHDARNLGSAALKYQQDGIPENTHYLLDGQQRATAIALGHLDLWNNGGIDSEQAKEALWIDLAQPPHKRDVEFVFRTLTKAHPWGYPRDYQRPTLHLQQISSWLNAFSSATGLEDCKINDIRLKDAWPCDAIAPIPVAFLLLADKEAPSGNQGNFILEQLKKTAFWSGGDSSNRLLWHLEQQATVRQALTNPADDIFPRFKMLMTDIRKLQSSYRIPVRILDIIGRSQSNDELENNEHPDPIETLFVRINSQEKPWEGEELIYSMLKSVWTEAPQAIEKLTHKMLVPSLLVLFCARLVLARSHSTEGKLPSAPSVGDFRRLMRGLDRNYKTYPDELKDFISGGASGTVQGVALFEKTHEFLTAGEFALPPVLAAELAQQAPEVFFLFLRWIDIMLQKGFDPSGIADIPRKKVLGFLTALSWFSPDRGAAASTRLWPVLNSTSEIESFFEHENFISLLKIDERGILPVIPLISPSDLKLIIEKTTLADIENQKSDLWANWDVWQQLAKEFLGQVDSKFNIHAGTDEVDFNKSLAWYQFINNKLLNNHSLLLYAQRHWLGKWFPKFDPSQPEYLEDKNRPWDYDHIHSQNFVQNDSGTSFSNIPPIILHWHRSIGNLRAWPLETIPANSYLDPSRKLTYVMNIDRHYEMKSEVDLRIASFIDDKNDWSAWQASGRNDSDDKYLSRECNQRISLIRAITTRFLGIYADWYSSLNIGDLMNNQNDKE